ncbi:FAD-binding protein, partial [Pseudogulbenkiania ferrooxidans]
AEEFLGIDPAKEPIPVRPAVHYTMGGILVDGHCAAPMPGLYAAGECSSVGIHGANRLGSNSLAELSVFGKVAGIEAARFARDSKPARRERLLKQAEAAEARLHALRAKDGTERIADLRREMAETMEAGCGIYRMEDSMRATCDKLAELKQRFNNVKVEDKSSVWNSDWLLAIELGYQLDVAEAMAHSALQRRESRGAHQRLDGYERRDDANFLKHSLAIHQAGAAPRIAYGAVRITTSQPGVRAYGAEGEAAEKGERA